MQRDSKYLNGELARHKASKYVFPISPEQWKGLVELMQNGATLARATGIVGLNFRTVQRYLAKGKKIENQGGGALGGTLDHSCWRLYKDVNQARQIYRQAHVNNINGHSVSDKPGKWAASAWCLQMNHPEEFCSRYQVNQLAETKMKEILQFLFQNGSDAFVEELAGLCGQLPSLKFDDDIDSFTENDFN
jgi:hypothetical protein